MGNSWFQFQQFKIHQDRCAMKISTDAILLGTLSEAEHPQRILDIGTGTGVIALMLAQRFDQAQLSTVELDEDAAGQARENFDESKFGSRIQLSHGSIQEFYDPIGFDLIVSNPPYFPDHLKSNDEQRNKALHTDTLSFEELIDAVQRLLSPAGKFWVILPPRQLEEFVKIGAAKEIELSDLISIRDRGSKPIFRQVACFSKQKRDLIQTEICLKEESGEYSNAYQSLLSGFLLNY